jgi:hypothetical protein
VGFPNLVISIFDHGALLREGSMGKRFVSRRPAPQARRGSQTAQQKRRGPSFTPEDLGKVTRRK